MEEKKSVLILKRISLLVAIGFVCFHLYTAIFGVLPGSGGDNGEIQPVVPGLAAELVHIGVVVYQLVGVQVVAGIGGVLGGVVQLGDRALRLGKPLGLSLKTPILSCVPISSTPPSPG